MMGLRGPGIDGDDEVFEKPLFQTFGMFVGMMFGLIMHWVVLIFKIPFPGYETEPATDIEKQKIYRTVKVKHPKGYLDTNREHLDHLTEVAEEDRAFEFLMNRLRLFSPQLWHFFYNKKILELQ